MELPITLWLTESQVDAITAAGKPYGRNADEQVLAWIATALAEAEKQHVEAQWAKRRRVIEATPSLVVAIDDVAKAPPSRRPS